jgi:predicted nuclease of predicted toxin-antitoxin system
VRRAIVDEQLPKRLARWIDRQPEWSADHVLDLGVFADVDIATLAEREQRLVVSKDEDFVTLRLPDRFPMLWLRFGNCHNDLLMTRIADNWTIIEELLESGTGLMELR